MSPLIPILFFALIAAGVGFFFWARRAQRRRLFKSLQLKLFLVELPPPHEDDTKPLEEVKRSEQLFAALAAMQEPFAFEVAVPYVGQEIHFYAAVPERAGETLLRQVQSLWSDAAVYPVGDYNIFNPAGAVMGGFVKLKERFVLPVRTYEEAGSDTFLSIVGGLTNVNEVGEGAAVQYVVRPAEKKRKKEVLSVLHLLKKGESLSSILKRWTVGVSDVSRALSRGEEKKDGMQKEIDTEAVKVVERKVSKSLFEVNIRILSSAPSEYQASALFEGIAAGFSQFGAPNRNEFRVVKPGKLNELVHQFSFRQFEPAQAMVLSGEELASVFHLPTGVFPVPRVKRMRTREAPPPAELPRKGLLIGESRYRGERRGVFLTEEDRRRHLYLVGQTGTGKTTFLKNVIAQDITAGRGVGVVDPHGELASGVLALVPRTRMDDVIVFDPGDLSRPMGLNMLEYDPAKPEQKTFIVNEMVGIFDKLYDLKATGGPMFEQYMRNALLLLMESAGSFFGGEPATLMEVPRVFTDAAFRARLLANVKNPTVIDFWEKEAAKAGGEAALANITPYITSKFNAFTANDYVRLIVGQARSSFSFREVLDGRKILIVNLSKGRIGEANASLLGMIVVGKLLMAALGRVDTPEESRADFYLTIDEFQNFTTDSIATVLSEARKYHLNLMVAHQFIAQLTDHIRDAVFGNVGSMVSFRVGATDAEFLVKQFAPVFEEGDLVNVDNFNACAKLLVGGRTAAPFNIETVPPPRGDAAIAAEIAARSRARYGRDREGVEAEILRRLRD
ncbi:MAG: hypothetical protein V1656_02675 [Candidatus Jorgensenbacteria bacterium]